jgi:hypothetical protein
MAFERIAETCGKDHRSIFGQRSNMSQLTGKKKAKILTPASHEWGTRAGFRRVGLANTREMRCAKFTISQRGLMICACRRSMRPIPPLAQLFSS